MQRYALNLSERNEAERRVYLKKVDHKDTKQLVFVDETSTYVGQSREYGWAAHNERVYD